MYNTGLAQVYLSQAAAASQKSNPDVQSVSALVARAVNAARVATDLSPKSVGIWENLATMYENAATIVPDARDWALKSLSTAIALEPSNPVLHWRLGNNYGLAGKWDEAIKEYQASTNLKKDYLDGFAGLANAYEQKGQVDQAVETYKQVMPYSLNSPEALFNFGRLLYNRNQGTDRSDSEKLWLEAVRLQPNYSNALYSLGLMYENRGNNSEALRYYYKVKDLNPGNKDITNKINSMVGGQ
jgi:tetratricopeptide (TPR) repeat protein